ncbi:MAG: FmdB family zinc ribbon protein [Desulfovibrionaceae bacterium]
MPIYEYRCSDCDQIFEEWQKNFDEVEVHCPVCGNKSERLISSTSFILKGSGWYVTDYCGRKPSTADSGSGGDNGKASSNGADQAASPPVKTESKPATTAATPSGGAAS